MKATQFCLCLCVIVLFFAGCLYNGGVEPLRAPEPAYASEGEYRDAVAISWAETPGAVGYAVYRSEEGSSGFTLVETCPNSELELLNCGSLQEDFPVIPGTVYTYRISAIDAEGNEGPSTNAVPGWAYPSDTPGDLLIEYHYSVVDVSELNPGEVSSFLLTIDYWGNGLLSADIDEVSSDYSFIFTHAEVDGIFQLICDLGLYRPDGAHINWPKKKIPNDDSMCTSAGGVVCEIPANVNDDDILASVLLVKSAISELLSSDLSSFLM